MGTEKRSQPIETSLSSKLSLWVLNPNTLEVSVDVPESIPHEE